MEERGKTLTDVEVVAAVIEKYHPRLSPIQAIVEANSIVAKLRTLRSVEPPLRERAAKFLDHFLHDYGKEAFEEATERLAAELTALRSQTLDEAARVADTRAKGKIGGLILGPDAAEKIMDHDGDELAPMVAAGSMTERVVNEVCGAILHEVAAAIRALPLPPGIK